MSNAEWKLSEMCDAIYGNGSDVAINYDDMSINYNEDGDAYYWLDCYLDGTPKNIFVCAKAFDEGKKIFTSVCISVSDETWYEKLDYLVNSEGEIMQELDERFEKAYKKALQ